MSSQAQRTAKIPDSPAPATRDLSKSGSTTQGTAGTAPPPNNRRRWMIIGGVAAVVVAVAAWLIFSGSDLPDGFAGGNGRLEANQIYVASKYAGRVKDVLVNEGDTVEAGQVVARMDTSALDAQLRQALAQITEAQDARNVALAQVAVKQAEYNYAAKQYA